MVKTYVIMKVKCKEVVKVQSNQQELAQVVSSLMSLKGGLEFESHRMQKLLLGDSPTKARCATRVGLGCSRSKAPVNRVGNQKKVQSKEKKKV